MNPYNFRKYRTDKKTRDLFAETSLYPSDFITPLFVVDGKKIRKEIKSLKGVFHLSLDELLIDIEMLMNKGINKILLFTVPSPEEKDSHGSQAYQSDNLASRVIPKIRESFPELVIMTDVCLCSFTNHGHCGLVVDQKIDHNGTLPLLAKTALTHARAGADIVAPSAMMDGQVAAIRKLLDEHNYHETKIMAYSAKYSSGFYGPFRDAANSAPSFGDRKSYQMDYRNKQQALMEMESDINEGADIIMVKPAHTYLDIIQAAGERFPGHKIAGYHVSGEYMLVKAAASAGYINEAEIFNEVSTAIKRAGANYIISYYIPGKIT